MLCSDRIPYTGSALHLGIYVGPDAKKHNLRRAIHELYVRTNSVVSKYRFCHFDTLRFLFNSFCTSFYGSPLWLLDTGAIEGFCVAWRKAAIKRLKLNNRARSKYLPHVLNTY